MSKEAADSKYFGASTPEIVGASMIQISNNLFNILMNFATYLATGGWGIGVMVAGYIVSGMRMWDGITDPIVAWFVPKVRSRFGVATPMIFLGWLFELVSIAGMFILFPKTQSAVLFFVLYFFYVIGYTMVNKAFALMKILITNDPKKRPLIARTTQISVRVVTMFMSLYRAKILFPKYGGLTLGLFQELAYFILIVTTVLMIVGLFCCRKYDDADEFERRYHGATNFTLKDIWNLMAHNSAFLTFVISTATDKIASASASAAAVSTMLFGIVIGNYSFSGDMSVYTTIVAFILIWTATGRARKKGSRDAYLKMCYLSILVAAVTCVFLCVIDPTTISKSFIPTAIFVVLYSMMSSFASTTNACVKSMEIDIADYDYYLHDKFLGPLCASVANLLTKLVDSASSIIISAALTMLGYVGTMPQQGDPCTPKLFWTTMALWLGMPVAGYIASIIAMHWYPLSGEKMEEVQATIKAKRDAAAAQSAK